MTKKIIREYFGAFRWRKIKEAYKNYNWWMMINLLFCFPVLMKPNKVEVYYLIMIPILFCLFSATLHPMTLPKLIYLCPMSRDARKEYINKSRYFRIGIPIILGSFCLVILMLTGICDWIWGVILFLNLVMLAAVLGSVTKEKGYGKIAQNGQRTMDMDTRQGIFETIVIMVALIISLVTSLLPADSGLTVWAVVLLAVVLLVELPCTIKYLVYCSRTIDQILFYEDKF